MATVLVVEDDPGVRALVTITLELDGHTTLEAPAAEVGLRLLEAQRPPVVVLDVGMAGLSGLGLLKLIRADPRLRTTRVLICTAYPHVREACMAAGADRFLVKPVTPTLLRQMVAELAAEIGTERTGTPAVP